MKVIKINKKDYQVHFGKSFLLRMERDFKINLMKLQESIETKPIETMMQILQAALDEGQRISGKEHKLTIYDIADAWDYDNSLMENLMTLFNESMSLEQKKNIDAPGGEGTE